MDFKKWYFSRTIWLAVLQFIAGGVMALMTSHPELGYLVVIKSVLDIVLRFNTEQGIN